MFIGHEQLIEGFTELAKKGKLSHGYFFYGAPRVGKKIFALHLANFLETGVFSEPKLFRDATVIMSDETGTIGIGAVRRIRYFLSEKPVASPRRTVIVDEAEAMTREAENALLKVAEEPPESSLLILIASDREALSPTLRSRLQNVYFSPVPERMIAEWLKKDLKCSADQSRLIAAASFGQPGLAWRMLKDDSFRSLSRSAEALLDSGFWQRRNMIKMLVEKDDFRFSALLEAMLMSFAKTVRAEQSPENLARWHRMLELRRQADAFNVNPRLQLEALLAD